VSGDVLELLIRPLQLGRVRVRAMQMRVVERSTSVSVKAASDTKAIVPASHALFVSALAKQYELAAKRAAAIPV
jgi:hypothetical protein